MVKFSTNFLLVSLMMVLLWAYAHECSLHFGVTGNARMCKHTLETEHPVKLKRHKFNVYVSLLCMKQQKTKQRYKESEAVRHPQCTVTTNARLRNK